MSPKPVLSLRKPPPPANIEAFVQGAGEPSTPTPVPAQHAVVEAVVDAPKSEATVAEVRVEPAPQSSNQITKRRGRGLLERADGRTTRRMTIYLSPSLAKQVVRFSAETEREISDIAAEALEKYLAANDIVS